MDPVHAHPPETFLLVRLNRPYVVATDCFDVRFESTLGGYTVEAFLPLDQKSLGELGLTRTAESSFPELVPRYWSEVYAQTVASPPVCTRMQRNAAGHLAIVGGQSAHWLVLASDAAQDEFIDASVRDLDGWRAIVDEWIAAFTCQDLDAQHPRWNADVQAAGLTIFARSGIRISHSNTVRVLMIDEIPASQAVLAHAFFAAGAGSSPPLSQQFLRDARAANIRGYFHPPLYRRALIDAGTAAEIALGTALRASNQNSSGKPTLGNLLTICANLDILSKSERDDAKSNLLNHRNSAVHRALSDYSELKASEASLAALGVATDLVTRFEPLTEP